MSFCKKEGKDKIIFATEEYLATPSNVVLLPDNPNEIDTSNVGAILPNGEINWDCPCLGNLPNGPCGSSFRKAFSCWVENKDDEEHFAENCFENFTKWEGCLSEHKDIYKQGNDVDTKATTAATSSNTVATTKDSLTIDNEAGIDSAITSTDSGSKTTPDSNRAIAAASVSK